MPWIRRYLTKEEKVVIGEWAAESVEELLGDSTADIYGRRREYQ